jgi:formate--tetrahydrofolate ligase
MKEKDNSLIWKTLDAVAAANANNYLLTAFYNRIYFGHVPPETADYCVLPYAAETVPPELQRVKVSVRVEHAKSTTLCEQRFVPVHECAVMSLLASARDEAELRHELGRIVVARPPQGAMITCSDIGAVENMMALLELAGTDLTLAEIDASPRQPGVRQIQDILAQTGSEAGAQIFDSYIAKIDPQRLDRGSNDLGKLVLVAGTTPLDDGEGKTTTVIGATNGLVRVGVKAVALLRQPSTGPIFGRKGPASGAGRSQLFPGRRINLGLTGDFALVEEAHRILFQALDDQIRNGALPPHVAHQVTLPYAVDLNARELRRIKVSLCDHKSQRIEADRVFVLTPASEIMAIMTLARDEADLRERLGRMIVAWTPGEKPITAAHLGAVDEAYECLKPGLYPNLVQTTEGNPVLISWGPFGNLAMGTNAIRATRAGLEMVGRDGVALQEVGFGAEAGFLKYLTIVIENGGIVPDGVILVTTVKALKVHGLENLNAHLGIIGRFGLPAVVAINRFPDDTAEEIRRIQHHISGKEGGEGRVRVAELTAVRDGGGGAEELAREILEMLKTPASLIPLYRADQPFEEKLEQMAKLYGAAGVDYSVEAQGKVAEALTNGYGDLPPLIVKTHKSLSDDPKKTGVPAGWRLKVKNVDVAAGAGYIRVQAGEASPLLLPALETEPRKLRLRSDVSEPAS